MKSRTLRSLYRRYKGICFYCGCKVAPPSILPPYYRKPSVLPPASVDHWLPRALGGTDTPSNLRLACRPCNMRKGNMHPDDWKAEA